jgi:hypothetical protein
MRIKYIYVLSLVLTVFGCNQQPLVDGPPVLSSSLPELAQTQMLKASNANYNDQFGTGGVLYGDAVAISIDGTTLAVGATFEAGGASDINGDQLDNSLYGAGAVYIYSNQGEQWVQSAYIKPSNPGIMDNFGYSVEISENGDTLVVSSVFEASSQSGINADPNDDSLPQSGAVYVFQRNNGQWVEEAYIKAPNTGHMPEDPVALSDGDQFGFHLSLSADGNTLAVSAITEDGAVSGLNGDMDNNEAISAGAVYIYERDDSGWSFSDYIKAGNAGGGDLFGYSLSFSGDANTLAVSGYDEDGSLASNNEVQDDDVNGMGAVYVFERDNSGWNQTAYLKNSYQERNDSMSVVVDLSYDGRTLVAGVLDEDSMATGVNPVPEPDWELNLSTGGVYVFVKDSDDAWVQEAYIKASNTGVEDWFGSRLELAPSGNVLFVAAQLEDSDSQGIDGDQANDNAQEAGAVYFYAREDGEWSQRYYFKASNTEEYDEFGSSLSSNFDGSLFAISARGEDSAVGEDGNVNPSDNSLIESGAVYLFSFE